MSISVGLPSTYFTVTCDFASGRSHLSLPFLRSCGLLLDQAVREVDRQRHEAFGLGARVAEHQALVAGALVEVQALAFIHALRDVGRLLVVGHEHGATLVVDAVVGVVVADLLDGVARDLSGNRPPPWW